MKSSSVKAKKPVKPVAKPKSGTGNAASKPAAKPGKPAKPEAKSATRKPVKAPVKVPVKKPSKAVAKPLAKSAAKPVAPAKRPAAKSAKVVAKAVPAKSKTPVKAKPVPAKPALSVPVAASKPPSKAPAALITKVPSKPIPPPAPPVAAPVAPVYVPGAVAQRAGRPSSRLASLTVPSMAQSVASTAAKASYSQLPTTPLIIPPIPSTARKDPKLANNWKTKTADQLSDLELLAMPDSEYMNEKQMAAFRLKLIALKQGILNSAGETTEHLREDTVVVPDPADRATIEEEHALELRTRDRERKLLKKIEQSIDRIDAGDYGYCDETGEPIGVGRLLARPTATLSLEAQQRRELKQKMFGD